MDAQDFMKMKIENNINIYINNNYFFKLSNQTI